MMSLQCKCLTSNDIFLDSIALTFNRLLNVDQPMFVQPLQATLMLFELIMVGNVDDSEKRKY